MNADNKRLPPDARSSRALVKRNVGAHLWRSNETDQSHVSLLHAIMDSVSTDQVSYLPGEHLTLTSEGRRHLRWDVGRKELVISGRRVSKAVHE